jgi:hypothetical protein
MTCFLVFSLVLLSSAAIAGEFPVTAAYGTPSGCAAFEQSGIRAVESGDDVSAILITPKEIAASGLTCPADQADVREGKVIAKCTVGESEPFTLAATIEENAGAGTAEYSSQTARVTLNRCK